MGESSLLVSLALFFEGLAGCAYISTFTLYDRDRKDSSLLRSGLLITIVSIALALACLWLDLGKPENIVYILDRPWSSLVSYGSAVLTLLLLVALLQYALKPLRVSWPLFFIGFMVAFAVAVYGGTMLYSFFGYRGLNPFLIPFIPLVFLFTSLAASYMLFGWLIHSRYKELGAHKRLTLRVAYWSLVLSVVLALLYALSAYMYLTAEAAPILVGEIVLLLLSFPVVHRLLRDPEWGRGYVAAFVLLLLASMLSRLFAGSLIG